MGGRIARVENLLRALNPCPEIAALFRQATSKQCVEARLTITAIWCFREKEFAEALRGFVVDALRGEEYAVWVEPVVSKDGWCAYLYFHAQVLEPVS